MLRRVDSARLEHQTNMFGKGYLYLHVGRRTAQVGDKKMKKEDRLKLDEYQRDYPAFLAAMEGRWYWLFQDRVFSDNERLSQEQVYALLVTRDQRNQRKVDRAVAMVQQGAIPQDTQRGHIPDDVKQYVWQRDGGRCRHCGSTSELQFDHIISVAMGGSSEPQNLQILCGPCNRMKGSGLTMRGGSGQPTY